jgi:hypothetical protein
MVCSTIAWRRWSASTASSGAVRSVMTRVIAEHHVQRELRAEGGADAADDQPAVVAWRVPANAV